MGYAALACRWLTGLVFLVAAASKARDFAGFRRSLAAMAPRLANRSGVAAGAVATAELLVAALVAVSASAAWGLVAALVLDLVFITAITAALRRGVHEPCRCFGATTRGLGTADVVRDVALAVVAALGLIAGLSGSAARQPAGWLVAAAVGAVGALLVIRLDDIVDLFFPGRPGQVSDASKIPSVRSSI